jgi:hypothetical protein
VRSIRGRWPRLSQFPVVPVGKAEARAGKGRGKRRRRYGEDKDGNAGMGKETELGFISYCGWRAGPGTVLVQGHARAAAAASVSRHGLAWPDGSRRGRDGKNREAFERRNKETASRLQSCDGRKRRRGLLACFFLHLRLTRGSHGCKPYSMRRVKAYPRSGGGSIVLVLCM